MATSQIYVLTKSNLFCLKSNLFLTYIYITRLKLLFRKPRKGYLQKQKKKYFGTQPNSVVVSVDSSVDETFLFGKIVKIDKIHKNVTFVDTT